MKSINKLLAEYDNDMNMALIANTMQIYKDSKKRGKRMSFTIESGERGQITRIEYSYFIVPAM